MFQQDAQPLPGAMMQDTDPQHLDHQPPNHTFGDEALPTIPAQVMSKTRRLLELDLLRGLLMMLMALDHNVLTLGSWPHGTNGSTEGDSVPVADWNRPIAYTIRSLSHICAPGFMFLLGLGVVYFCRSRSSLGWSRLQLARHFVMRAVALTLVSICFGLALNGGRVWLFNIVLVALAVDYLLVGLLWLGISVTEPKLAELLTAWIPDHTSTTEPEPNSGDETQPLLSEHLSSLHPGKSHRPPHRAASISWHMHNLAIFGLGIVSIWWNIWLSPTGGHCVPGGPPEPELSLCWRFWFYSIFKDSFPAVISTFPPLAWVSFSILGLLYGRVFERTLLRSNTSTTVINVSIAIFFLVIFVLTRVLRFGNLSEHCLHPSETGTLSTNPYLVSPEAFFYIVKYPPDVAFASFTLAGNFFLLSLFTSIPVSRAARWLKPIVVFGTSALFFYVVHLTMLFSINTLLVKWLGHDMGYVDPSTGQRAVGIDNLWIFFSVWFTVLLVLYFLCSRYSAFKNTKGVDSLWRLF